jgi:hypothetical protein
MFHRMISLSIPVFLSRCDEQALLLVYVMDGTDEVLRLPSIKPLASLSLQP